MLQHLEGIEPGPDRARILESIDASQLSEYDQVVVLLAHQRMVSHHAARM